MNHAQVQDDSLLGPLAPPPPDIAATRAEFERWIVEQYAATNGFTALILLLTLGEDKVGLISFAYVRVTGNEVKWRDMKTMLDASRRKWLDENDFVGCNPVAS